MLSNTNFAGINENNKPSSKVLRPPGGGSSDIFGSDVPSTPRSVKNHMQSNIFSCEKGSVKNNGDQPRRGQKNVDSYTRLFGDPERPFTPAKNHMKSSIPFGGTAAAAAAAAAENGNGAANGNGLHASNGRNGKSENGGSSSSASSVSSSTENLKMNGLSKTDGNPVTGEGYKPAGAEINTTIPSLNGANQVINKNRIPPGGFSSGLW